MMRRLAIMAGGVLLLGLLLGVITTVVYAQALVPEPPKGLPEVCFPPEHDLNGDEKVNELDFNLWKDWLFAEGDDCELGAPAELCRNGMDTNGDGYVTFDDLNLMLYHYKLCLFKARGY
ncbi:MAG: hypothetical protein ACK2UL_11500 [Anaerolineae bacterium]|jgi:hypothetical protein